jgi:hypothetical protein
MWGSNSWLARTEGSRVAPGGEATAASVPLAAPHAGGFRWRCPPGQPTRHGSCGRSRAAVCGQLDATDAVDHLGRAAAAQLLSACNSGIPAGRSSGSWPSQL